MRNDLLVEVASLLFLAHQQEDIPRTESGESRREWRGLPACDPMIQLENISKVYGDGDTEVRALWEVNLEIKAGEYLAIMGQSGSGKSTMMHILGCLDRPTSGIYRLQGKDIAQLDDDERAHIRNRSIGFVFQEFNLLPQLSALDNVMLPMVYGGLSPQKRKEQAIEVLERVGLGNRLKNRPNELSGGQKQRVAIARAIVNRPVLILADEPTGALDTTTSEEVMNLFSELNQQGLTVILVTHEPDVASFTERVILFRDGQVREDPYILPTRTAVM